MKYVLVPADIAIINKRTGKPVIAREGDDEKELVFTMRFFVEHYITNAHAVMQALGEGNKSSTGDGLRRMLKFQQKMERLFENAKPGDLIAIEDADYRTARKVVDSITWHPDFLPHASQVLPIVEAWENADKQDEEWKKEQDAAKRPTLAAVPAPSIPPEAS